MLNECFDYRKYQIRGNNASYDWEKYTAKFPTRTAMQIKDKVRNMHNKWVRAQQKEKLAAWNNDEEFEEVVFDDLETYKGEGEEEEEVVVVTPTKQSVRAKNKELRAQIQSCYVDVSY